MNWQGQKGTGMKGKKRMEIDVCRITGQDKEDIVDLNCG